MVAHLLQLFPRLQADTFHVTSPRDRAYNCVAWAAGVTDAWWWPIGEEWEPFWPDGVPREVTIEAFRLAFGALRYVPAESPHLQEGVEKVAIFAEVTRPTHAARQLSNGRWTSKLGKGEDIEHELHDLEGDIYGTVVLVLQRPKNCPNE
jgi:hypothetical protein